MPRIPLGRAAEYLGGGLFGALGAGQYIGRGVDAMGSAGRAVASASNNRPMRGALRAGKFGLLTGAAGLGVASAVLNSEGPYGDIAEDVFGDRQAFGYNVKAGILSSQRDPRLDTIAPMKYYYGRPYNSMGASRLQAPRVSGDVVFGAYNMRRESLFNSGFSQYVTTKGF